MTYFRDYITGTGLVRVFTVVLETEPEPNGQDFEEAMWATVAEVRELEFASNCRERLIDYFQQHLMG